MSKYVGKIMDEVYDEFENNYQEYDERVEYLISYCLKNYYIKQANEIQ